MVTIKLAAMVYICNGTFQSSCETSKSHAMCCDAFSNMLVIFLPILGYLSYLVSESQTDLSKIFLITIAGMNMAGEYTFHRENQTGHISAIFLEKLAMIRDGL